VAVMPAIGGSAVMPGHEHQIARGWSGAGDRDRADTPPRAPGKPCRRPIRRLTEPRRPKQGDHVLQVGASGRGADKRPGQQVVAEG